MFRFLLLVMFVSSWPLAARADFDGDLKDDNLLKESVADIGKLTLRQTEALAQAIVQCTERIGAKTLSDGCVHANRYFVIVSSRTGSLAVLYQAWSTTKGSIEIGGGYYEQRASRLLWIETEWQKALRQRFAVLDKTQ
jgi:hypothetical protein